MKRPIHILLAVALVALSTVDASASDISREWLDLWTRCRIAIETAGPLDTTGLESRKASPSTQKSISAGFYSDWRLWGSAGNRFEIADMERQVKGGVVRNCDVHLASNTAPLTDEDQGAIVREFLVARANLIAAGAHSSNDPSPIWPLIPLGVGPDKPNANGCLVISAVFFDPTSKDFMSFSGEQSRVPCSGPTHLGPSSQSTP